MFRLKSTTAEATTTIRLAVPQSLYDHLTVAAAEANIEIQEAARQAIAYAFSHANKAPSSRTTKKTQAQTTAEGDGRSAALDAAPGSNLNTSGR